MKAAERGDSVECVELMISKCSVMVRTLRGNDVEVKYGKEFPRVKSLKGDKVLWKSRLRDGAK